MHMDEMGLRLRRKIQHEYGRMEVVSKKKINMHFHVKEGTRFKNGREKEGASAPRGIEWKSKTILQRED